MRSVSLLLVFTLVVSGCARFDDQLDDPFTPAPGPGMAGAPPSTPRGTPSPPPTSSTDAPEPAPETGPCVDPDPAVIATCLEPAVAVAGLGERALLAESTGGIKIVAPETPPEDFGRIDPRGGRVSAVVPSPDFEQDRLVYALVVGGGPTRVERLARGDSSRTVAELPPAESGGLAFVDGVLTVGAGDQLVRFPGFTGIGRAENPEVIAGGLGRIQSLCTHEDDVFLSTISDRGASLRTPDRVVWTWPDQRVAGGCAAGAESLSIALPDAERVDTVQTADGAALGQPEEIAQGKYGRLTGLTMIADGVLLAGTTNKDGGTSIPTDDRAVILPESGGGGDART